MKPNGLWRPEFGRLFVLTFMLVLLIVVLALVWKLFEFLFV